jgi:S-disulfanyl-L-cysteine oxidoreductase SoxD
MFTPERCCLLLLPAVLLAACATVESGDAPHRASPRLGEVATPADIASVDISIPPSGIGLPPGAGDARMGAKVYAAKCQACHGEKGTGKPADPLVGGLGTLASPSPVRTVGSYWPYATTLFDYTRRAMPTTAPQSLTADEVYAVTAYVLYLNGIISESHTLDAQTLPRVQMPNRDGFVDYSKVR